MFDGSARKLPGMFLAAGLILSLGACGDATSSPSSSTLSVQLTDAEGDLANAWVEITEIRMQGQSDAGPGGVTLLDESTGLIELTSLADDVEELVSDITVASGTYAQLRIVIGAAAVETEGGDVFSKDGAASDLGLTATGSLVCPSCEQTGIKVNMPDGALRLEGDSKILMLDFDVSQSFGRQAGMSGQWVMNPLIRTSTVEASGNVTGSVGLADGVSLPMSCGGVEPTLEDFVPLALDPSTGEVVKSGDVASDGSYSIDFLEPGTYDLGFESDVGLDGATLQFDATVMPDQVTVESGSVENADYTITGATCDTGSGS